MSRPACRSAALLALLVAAAAGAATTSDRPTAILVYPEIRIGADVDTRIQLTNASDELIDANCFYEITELLCVGGAEGDSCTSDPVICSGVCEYRQRRVPFHVRLTDKQPIAWRADAGLSELPLDGEDRVGVAGQNNRTTYIPPLGDGPLAAVLRCAVEDVATGEPRLFNALVGQAIIVRSTDDDRDAVMYRAIGVPALVDTNFDDALAIGGPNAEYAACPTVSTLEHFFVGSPLTTGPNAAVVETDLVLVPCGSSSEALAGAVAQFLIYNEFGQRFSTSRSINGRLALPLNAIDTTVPNRSIFSVNVGATLAARTQIHPIGSGMFALAFERHRDRATDRVNTAALEVHQVGDRLAGDEVVLPPRACAGDCNDDGAVSIDELVTNVGIAITQSSVDACRIADMNTDGFIAINELIASVGHSLEGCPTTRILPTPSPSPSPPPVSPSPLPGTGPDITLLGLATADDLPLGPDGTDDQGRPIYARPHGQGFTLIVEARRAGDRRTVGQVAYRPGSPPDLQVLVSRPLGDGGTEVCEDDGVRGGVPAVPELQFSDSDPATVDALNDLGCRAYERTTAVRPCTRVTESGGELFAYVADQSEFQFCLPIARAWSFPAGDTIVAARVRDVSGNFGAAREIVVRIEQ